MRLRPDPCAWAYPLRSPSLLVSAVRRVGVARGPHACSPIRSRLEPETVSLNSMPSLDVIGTCPVPNVARDFAGLIGSLDLSRRGSDESEVTEITDDFPGKDRPTNDQAYLIQLKRPGSGPRKRTAKKITAVAWAGSIWQVPGVNHASEVEQCQRLLIRTFLSDEFSFVNQIDGEFAASVLTSKRAVLVRNRGSQTPIYYRLRKDKLIWSTNYLDLIDDPLNDVDPDRLAVFSWGGNLAPYQGIVILRPGEYVTFTSDGLRTGVFDESPEPTIPKDMSLADWGEYIRKLIGAVVEKRVRRFRRVGVLLSGGIDSSGLVRSLVDLGADVTCYNWSSESFGPADESMYAKSVCEYLGLPLRLVEFGDDRLTGRMMIDPSWTFKVPHPHPLFALWKRTVELASQEVECLVSGSGGDGSFGIQSYFSIRSVAGRARLRDVPAIVKHGLALTNPMGWMSYRWSPQELAYMRGTSKIRAIPRVRSADIFTDRAQSAVVESFNQEGKGEAVRLTSLEVNLIRPNGLVHLTPYLDPSIVSLKDRLPYTDLPYAGQLLSKTILRRAFLGLLPSEVIRRADNPFFSGVNHRYMLNNRDTIKEYLNESSALVRLGVIDHSRLLDVLQDDDALTRNATTIVLSIFTSMWLNGLGTRS